VTPLWFYDVSFYDALHPIVIARSLGEASAENKGHGPETSRDADGQDRYRRHKALSPVAEDNKNDLYVPQCQSSTREGLSTY